MKTSSINKREKDVINENQNKIEKCGTKNHTLGTTYNMCCTGTHV